MIRDFFLWLESLPDWLGIPLALLLPLFAVMLLLGCRGEVRELERLYRQAENKPEGYVLIGKDWLAMGGLIATVILCAGVFIMCFVPLLLVALVTYPFRYSPLLERDGYWMDRTESLNGSRDSRPKRRAA